MQKLVKLSLVIGLSLSFLGLTVHAEDKVIEIAVKAVLAPEVGFDDNDNVQVVVDGLLPNACYAKAMTRSQIDNTNHKVIVTQFALLRTNGACANPETLPDSMKMPIPFMSELDLGQLTEGAYTVYFKTTSGLGRRQLSVAKAPTDTVDSLFYAITNYALIPDLVSIKDQNIKVTLSGFLNSSCTVLDDKVVVHKVNDVVVLLPQVKQLDNYCLPVTKNFLKDVEFPNPGPGRYLLHIRSVNGTAVNRLFTVQ